LSNTFHTHFFACPLAHPPPKTSGIHITSILVMFGGLQMP